MNKTKIRLAIILGLLFSINVSAQKTYLLESEIPTEIANYVSRNFHEHRIKKIIKTQNNNKKEYEIKLNRNTELEFDENFKIKEIESKKGISRDLLPSKINDYLRTHYSDTKVTEWELNEQDQRIELKNGIRIQFDLAGNLLKSDSNL